MERFNVEIHMDFNAATALQCALKVATHSVQTFGCNRTELVLGFQQKFEHCVLNQNF